MPPTTKSKKEPREASGAGQVPRPSRKRAKVASYNDDAVYKAMEGEAESSGKSGKSARQELEGAASYRDGTKQPPQGVEVLPGSKPVPKRDAKTGRLAFADHPEFAPNLTPAEVMQRGSFGGTYWRPISSGVTGETYKEQWKEFPSEWFKGLNPSTHLARPWNKYDASVNTFGAKCGGTLDMWESSGWISSVDPYGWFQWYCRFYLGRRTTDDTRQISRGLGVMGPGGRFKNQLIGKVARAGAALDDKKISPVIRQALQHWGYELTRADADAYCRKKSLPPCK